MTRYIFVSFAVVKNYFLHPSLRYFIPYVIRNPHRIGTDIVDDIAYSLLFFNRINHQCVPVLSNYIVVKT